MKKGEVIETTKDYDYTKTGGPFIPKGASMKILSILRGNNKGLVWGKVSWSDGINSCYYISNFPVDGLKPCYPK